MKLKLTHTSPPHPPENTHMHPPHHTVPSLASISGTVIQVFNPKRAPWHVSLFLCPPPLSLWSLTWRNSTIAHFFLLFQKQHNCCLFLSSSFLLVVAAADLRLQDNGSFRTGLVSVSSCTRHRWCGQGKIMVPVFLLRGLDTSGCSSFPHSKALFLTTTNWFLVSFFPLWNNFHTHSGD